ncbi:carbohydrate ABC transporter permease [Sutcliffiella cohnii]
MKSFFKQKKNTAVVLSALSCGIGQFYNKQWLKGSIFLGLQIAFIIAFKDLINMGLWGIVTLGTNVERDHSIFLLVEGIIALIVIGFGLLIYAVNLYDSYYNGRKRDRGEKLNTVSQQFHQVVDKGFPYLILSPGFFLLIFAVVFPLIFMVLLSFTNYSLYNSPPAKLVDWVGFQNFIDMFKMKVWRDTFFSVLSWTIIWTVVATTGQIIIGIGIAVILNQPDLKGKAIFRTLFILPWAVPGFVSILIFAGMFNETFGTINKDILSIFGLGHIPWLTDPFWTRIAVILVQFWLGFPFIMAMTTGVLQSIPRELYEAATVDGASSFQKFKSITLPMILFAISPILITQYTFNFNNFNVIYLFNGGGPAAPGQNAGSTDILISWVYGLTMTSAQYSKAAAITVLLSIIIMTIALFQFRRTKSFKEEDMM